MRIHYLINGLNGGGAAFPIPNIIGLMRECGHQVQVIALMPQDRMAAPRLEQASIPYEIIGKGPRDYVGQAARLISRLRRDRPDLIWTSLTRGTIYGQIAGGLLRIPVVSWQHSAFLKPGNLAILRRTVGLTRRWIADSESVKDFAEKKLGVATGNVDIWPLFNARREVPQSAPWSSGRFRIGTLGRLHPSKQYDVLIRAIARVRELSPRAFEKVELTIGGTGPELDSLQALAASLKLDNIRFAGFVEKPQEFLAGLHAYVQTSLKEGLCIAAHEAMQAGLPVVATRVGELAYSVVSNETGWLCEVGDVDALAQAVLALVCDPHAAKSMGEAGRARVLGRFGGAQFETAGRRILDRIQRELVVAH